MFSLASGSQILGGEGFFNPLTHITVLFSRLTPFINSVHLIRRTVTQTISISSTHLCVRNSNPVTDPAPAASSTKLQSVMRSCPELNSLTTGHTVGVFISGTFKEKYKSDLTILCPKQTNCCFKMQNVKQFLIINKCTSKNGPQLG